MEKDLEFWLAFHNIPGFKSNHFNLIKSKFDSIEKAWKAPRDTLSTVGIPKSVVNHIVSKRSHQDPLEQLEKLSRYGIEAMTSDNLFFQTNLQRLLPISPIIYYKGNIALLERKTISLIGGLETTDYSREVARNIIKDLVASSYAFVGGLAKGMDALCHSTMLLHKGKTIGVLSSGIDVISPSQNLDLSREITNSGLLISNQPIGTRPLKQSYLSSEHLVTEISAASIFIEGKEDGTELSIILNALKQKKPVFAIPGNIFSDTSRGPNLLITQGSVQPIVHFGEVIDYLEKIR